MSNGTISSAPPFHLTRSAFMNDMGGGNVVKTGVDVLSIGAVFRFR